MTVDEVSAKLKSMNREGIKNGWSETDTQGEETYGLNYTAIQKASKEFDKDPFLADELYASNNHDLKVLAALIDDPESYTQDELKKRSEQLYISPFAEKFCQKVMAKSPHAVHFVEEWIKSDTSVRRCFGYLTLQELAKNKNNLADDFFSGHLEGISSRLPDASEEERKCMVSALSAIAKRNERLQKEGLDLLHDIDMTTSATHRIERVLLKSSKPQRGKN
ncbi:MAG: DNA alkylation repair protein [Cryomorphaceae bacterium]|nr:DNA alkylation repair protein [Flavobacteriales bacterium]